MCAKRAVVETKTIEHPVEGGKVKALETTLANLNKKYGDGVVMKLGEATRMAVEAIPTGSLSLDIALGVGGVPKGRVVEIYGPESSGKTTICLHAIAEAQKRVDCAPLLTWNMHSIQPMQAKSVWMLTVVCKPAGYR